MSLEFTEFGRSDDVTEEEKKASANRSDIAVAVGTLGAAGATSALGLPAEANTILAASGVLLTASKGLHSSELLHRVQDWFASVPALYVARMFNRVNERIEQETIEVDPVNMIDLLRTASQFVADAATEEKRRMMEEVIINGARRSRDAAAQIEATKALEIISQMPEAAALIFSETTLRIREIAPDSPKTLEHPLPGCGLEKFIWEEGRKYLYGDYHYPSSDKFRMRMPFRIYTREPLVDDVEGDDEGQGVTQTNRFELSSQGRWLADWITNNPAPRPETEEASPTE